MQQILQSNGFRVYNQTNHRKTDNERRKVSIDLPEIRN